MDFRRSARALALLIPVAACQPAGTPQPTFAAADETAIRGMPDQYVAAVVAEDWAGNVASSTTDAVPMPPNEPMRQGHDALTAWLAALPPVTGFTVTPAAVDGDGGLAYARGAFTLDLAPPDAEPVHMVGKWRRCISARPTVRGSA